MPSRSTIHGTMVSAGIVSTLFFWGLAASSALVPAPQVARRVHNLPGTSDEFTLSELARRLVDVARREQKTVFENGTEVYMSWTDALLFKQYVACSPFSAKRLEM
jgi:hypothetical protein